MANHNSEAKAMYGASVLISSKTKKFDINQADIPDFNDGSKSL